MELLVTAEKMREIEQSIIHEFGLPAVVLMERAALCALQELQGALQGMENPRILIACGMGNNGADGMALARMLVEKGYCVTLVTVGDADKRTELNALQYHCYQTLCNDGKALEITAAALGRVTKENPREYAIIVDAILGIGVSRPLAGGFAQLVELLNALAGYKIALDLPTGIHTDTGEAPGVYFSADETVCFGAVKTGVCISAGKTAAGRVVCDSCGMLYGGDLPGRQETAETGSVYAFDGAGGSDHVSIEAGAQQTERSVIWSMTRQDLAPFLYRDANGNKGSFGKVGMIVGSRTVPGAALLSSAAAYRSGCGYIRILTHEANRDLVMERTPEAVLELYRQPEDACIVLDALAAFSDVVVAGCGMGTGDGAQTILMELLEKPLKGLILDADALTILAGSEGLMERVKALPCPVILTPHMKEFERVSKIPMQETAKDRLRIAREFAAEYHVILVLKDAQTVVAAPDGRCMINRYGNDGMAVAGSGDVLCGIIASMVGQNRDQDVYNSVCAGVVLHAMAGDMAKDKLGAHSMLPTDIIECLPEIIRAVILNDC